MTKLSSLPLQAAAAELFRRWGGFFILIVVSLLLYNHFFLSRAYIEFEYLTDVSTTISIFWADEGEDYSHEKLARGRLIKNRTTSGFFIGDLRKTRYIRLDPMKRRQGTVTFQKITITQPGMDSVVIEGEDGFQHFHAGADIAALSFSDQAGMTVTSTGSRPKLHLVLEPPGKRRLNVPLEASRFFTLILLLHLLLRSMRSLNRNYFYVSLMGFGVVLLALCMAMTTTLKGAHPDEGVHVQAAGYYKTHWLMPEVESPEIETSYSRYGVSRLNYNEISYLLAGKFARLLDNTHLPSYKRFRLFNVTLLALLVLLSFHSPAVRLVCIPLLMTPQAWYLFSYYNSDGFAFFAVTVAGCQLVDPESLFNRYLSGRVALWKALLLLGPLFTSLLLVKKNFFFYLVFIFLYLVASFAFKRFQPPWPLIKKIVVIVFAGLAVFSVRYGLDININGFDKGEKVARMREIHAEKIYKPSTSLEEKHPYLHLSDQGVSIHEFLEKYRWAGKTVRSFYGVYSYMTVSGTTSYYDLMRRTGYLFLCFIALNVLVRGNWYQRSLLINVAFCGTALIAMACYTAWTMDFQAQGRYILVMLPMLGVLIAHTERLLQPLLLRSFVLFMFVMSAYNFIFVGLYDIKKFGWG